MTYFYYEPSTHSYQTYVPVPTEHIPTEEPTVPHYAMGLIVPTEEEPV
jgi:hypothetical protein